MYLKYLKGMLYQNFFFAKLRLMYSLVKSL